MRVIGHRGNSASAPENTMSAFVEAFRQGAQGIELDVAMTKDEQLIVFHDSTLDRTTNGKGYIANTSYAQIAMLDAGSWFSPAYAQERIPLLDDVLEHFGKKGEIIIEIKDTTARMPLLVEKTLLLVERLQLSSIVLIQSFYDRVLRCSKEKARQPIRLEKFTAAYVHPVPILVGMEINFKKLAAYGFVHAFGFDYLVTEPLVRYLTSIGKQTYLGARATLSHSRVRQLRDAGLAGIMRNNVTPLLDLQ